jgi:hypothetical protein
MRIWSLHPEYLDSRGLVALWREALLARAVLEGATRGYRNHPQLSRFKADADPVGCLNFYLSAVYDESKTRGYSFDKGKLPDRAARKTLPLTRGQLVYEFAHLLDKLAARDPERRDRLKNPGLIRPHPLFFIIEGGMAEWEKVKSI